MRNRTPRTCTALNKQGKQCGSPAMRDRVVCWGHSTNPEDQERFQAARSKGGKVRAWNVHRARELAMTTLTQHADQLKTAEDCRKLLSETTNALLLGKIDPRIAGQIGFMVSGVLKAVSEVREAALAEAQSGPTRIIMTWPTDPIDPDTLPERDPEILRRLEAPLIPPDVPTDVPTDPDERNGNGEGDGGQIIPMVRKPKKDPEPSQYAKTANFIISKLREAHPEGWE